MPLQTLMEFAPGGFATMQSRQAGLGVTCPVDSGMLHIGAALAGAIVKITTGAKPIAAAAKMVGSFLMSISCSGGLCGFRELNAPVTRRVTRWVVRITP